MLVISYNDIKQIFYAISWTPMETTRQYSWEMVKMVKIFVMQPMNLCINFLKKKIPGWIRALQLLSS